MPPSVPLNHYLGSGNQQNRRRGPIPLFHADVYKRDACVEHSNLFKVNSLTILMRHPVKSIAQKSALMCRRAVDDRKAAPQAGHADPTTSFLTSAI